MSTLVVMITPDRHLCEEVVRLVQREGLEVVGAATVGEGMIAARRATAPLVLLNPRPGEERVLGMCQDLRNLGVPLILYLASPGDRTSPVTALESGADDFVTLPCPLPELLARIQALLRRSPLQEHATKTEIELGELSISLSQRRVTLNDRSISLTPKEFEILMVLAQRAGKVVPREELVRLVWGTGRGVKRQTMDVYFFSLRSKIEEVPERPRRLQTVRGVGYRLVDTVSPD